MLFHLLVSISISAQRFCLCQPDRPGDVCSLQKKCHRYASQSNIIVYNPQTKFNKNLFSEFNSSQKNIKGYQENENSNIDSLIFEVFGSKSGNKKIEPISINMLDDMFSDISKLTIYGGEFNQVVKIRNFNNSEISLEAQNIQLTFENDQLIFNKLSLKNSFLKKENPILKNSQNAKLSIIAKEVIGDSTSLSSEYYSAIETEKLQVFDKENSSISNNFGVTAPIKIINSPSEEFSSHSKMNILEDETTDSSIKKFSYYFCIATTSRLSRIRELAECDKYSVPISNYFTGRETDFLSKVANAPDNTTIRLYITQSTESDPVRINFNSFQTKNITLSFISADVDVDTRIEIMGKKNSVGTVSDLNLTFSASKINYILLNIEYGESFKYIQLFQSPIYFEDNNEIINVHNLITDGVSIAQFSDFSIYINETLTLLKASPTTIKGKIYLDEGCTININQYTNFPFTRYNKDNENYYLTLSDSIEDQRLDLYLKGKIIVNYLEGDVALLRAPTITFAGGKTITKTEDRTGCPYLNFTIQVPSVGLIVNFGTGSTREVAFPHQSVFTFVNTTEVSDLNFTINDFGSIESHCITDMYVLAFARGYRLNAMTPSTTIPYLKGINKAYKEENGECQILFNCTNDTLPFFFDRKRNKCYQIGGYDLNSINLDVQDQLSYLTYDEDAVLVQMSELTDPAEQKFPHLAKTIQLTLESDNITFSINNTNTFSDNITFLDLDLKSEPTIYFNSSYKDKFLDGETCYENDAVMSRLTLNHGSNNLLLKTDGFPIPKVEINNPVVGVLYSTGKVGSPIESISDSTFNGTTNTRIGPTVNVTVESGTVFPQDAFLAESVIFRNDEPDSTMTFKYYNQSRSDYSFYGISVKFASADSNKTVHFKGKSLSLFDGSKILPNDPLYIEIEDFSANIPVSILSSSVQSAVKVAKSISINISVSGNAAKLLADASNNEISQVIFGEKTITLVDKNGNQAAPIEVADNDASAIIETDQSSEILFSVEPDAESVPSNLEMKFTGDAASINFDKSWNNVEIPPTFSTDFESIEPSNVKLSTEMMGIPNITIKGVDGSVQVSTHKRKLTKDLAFYIFIGITALIFVITLILCIVGLTCCKYNEELDVSSSAESASNIAVGELNGLPYTAAEVEKREKNASKIREEKERIIKERKKKEEKRRKKNPKEEEDGEDDKDEEESASYEDAYNDFDIDDIYHNNTSSRVAPIQTTNNDKKKKKNTETSEEFKLAKKKAQLNANSGAPDVPKPPPKKSQKEKNKEEQIPIEDVEEVSYNSNEPFSEVSD